MIIVCVRCSHSRPTESEWRSPESHAFTVLTSQSRPVSHFPTYDEIPGAQGGLDKTLDYHGYERLGQQRYSADPPPSPPARDADKLPPPPVIPRPRVLDVSRKDYLHFAHADE